MACCIYCLILMGLFCVSCKTSEHVDMVCTEITANKNYCCEDLGLTEIPKALPAITEILDFSFNFLPSLHNSTFNMLKSLVYLDLTRCQINWVYENVFQSNAKLNTIVLTGNLLLFLAETAFAGPYSLKHLVLTQTGLTSIMFIPLHNLDNLETLLIGSNHISSLELPPNFPTRELRYLDLQMNNIESISTRDTKILKQTQNLTLSLKGNAIVHIEPGAFNSSSFYSLDFGGCIDISVILAGIQNIQTVILWLGTFQDVEGTLPISPVMLQDLCSISVENVNLQMRHFRPLSTATFLCLTKLRNLDLTHAGLTAIPPNISGMKMLKELNLNENSFQHICNISSAVFPSLTHLSVRMNLEELNLGSGCLEALTQLQYLDLSNSQIENSDCCNEQLKGLSNLQYLNLSYNKQHWLKNGAFNECAKLEVLDLAFTHLHISASQGSFHNLHLLQILNLSHTFINTGIQHLLTGLQNLVLLNLDSNSFDSGIILNDNLFQEVPSLKELILSSCELISVQSRAFHSLRDLKHVDLSHNKLTALSTEAFSNLKNMYLNFANNRIHFIPRDMLTSLSGKSIINLSYNPLECSCSNIGLLTWYKQNLDKIEAPEGTVCCEHKSLAGMKLSAVTLSCGMGTAGAVFLALAVIIVIVASLILTVRFLKRQYHQI
uniref:CD180 molecule n=1 Tax=Sphenodon punctatus TaxID=8508 RepID=A0A8D0GPS8_SPHPU